MDEFECTILGQVYSKANARKFAKMSDGRIISIKSDAARAYEQSAVMQLKSIFGRRQPLKGELAIEATIYYPTQRQDLDASLVFDVLQKAGVIGNDRQLREHHLFHSIDKENPRVELSIWPRG